MLQHLCVFDNMSTHPMLHVMCPYFTLPEMDLRESRRQIELVLSAKYERDDPPYYWEPERHGGSHYASTFSAQLKPYTSPPLYQLNSSRCVPITTQGIPPLKRSSSQADE